jgi:hypothetical protein
MKTGKGLLDRSGVRSRIAKKVEEVKKFHFSNGRPLIIGENGKMFRLYGDGRKEEILPGKIAKRNDSNMEQ